jgi:hypothetical protein
VWEFFPKGEDKMRYLTALVLTAALASVASAQISGEVVSYVTPAAPTDLLNPIAEGAYMTNDVVVEATSDWLSAVMSIELTQGTIYQHGAGNNVPPNPLFFPIYPGVQYDTYVTNGAGASVSLDAAVDLGYAATGVPLSDADSYALSWFTSATGDIGSLMLARVTLSSDAVGTWQINATANNGNDPAFAWSVLDGTEQYGEIANGVMLIIPEPATMALLAFGGVAALIRRKR